MVDAPSSLKNQRAGPATTLAPPVVAGSVSEGPHNEYVQARQVSQAFLCSLAQLCLTLCDPMDCSTPGFPVFHHLLEFVQTHIHLIESVMLFNRLILCHPLLLLPSIFPSIRVFSNESALSIR